MLCGGFFSGAEKFEEQFFFQQKRGVSCVWFLCRNQNCSSSFLQQESGGQIIYFWGILLQKGFLILIRFRGQFLGEIFINLS